MKILLSKDKADALIVKLNNANLKVETKALDDEVLFVLTSKEEAAFLSLLKEVIDEAETLWLDSYEGKMNILPSGCLFFEVVDPNVILRTDLNETIYLRHTLADLELILKSLAFERINKSVIVNLKKITFIKPLLNSKLEIKLGHYTFEVSRFYLKNFRKALKEKGGI
ncbi:MAG: LytTR family transcriptional regulator [Acholeplasmataceae bacterium]|nr:LytTR family transcriptional regulator [Acholeplasmataceae bacterium]